LKYIFVYKLVSQSHVILAEAGTITFILISDQIVDHCSKIDLRSDQDHMVENDLKIRSDLFIYLAKQDFFRKILVFYLDYLQLFYSKPKLTFLFECGHKHFLDIIFVHKKSADAFLIFSVSIQCRKIREMPKFHNQKFASNFETVELFKFVHVFCNANCRNQNKLYEYCAVTQKGTVQFHSNNKVN
jgi:hypothetical protein